MSQERKPFRTAWNLTPPSSFGADWKADTLEEAKPNHENLGPRAWWLYQLTRRVPLAWWQQATGMNPRELLSWAKEGEWREALWRGWLERLDRNLDPDWAEAFLEHIQLPGPGADPFELALALPPAQREKQWLKSLQMAPPGLLGRVLSLWLSVVPADGPAVSADFARGVFEIVAAHGGTSQSVRDYALRDALSEFVALLPPEVFGEARACWDAMPAHIPATAAAQNRFPSWLELRQRILEHPLLKEDRP